MNKVLIVGTDSYIGSSFEMYSKGRLDVTTVSSLNKEWEKIDYSAFDSVLFVAGIAHKRQTAENKDLYFAVNRDLAASVAQKAKSQVVSQFIYLSSMAVYGMRTGIITESTVPAPLKDDYYGLSKYQAEKLIAPMNSADFHVVIVRPPMVYGLKCKGNFSSLVKIARTVPFVPAIANKRSMIFIDNLSEFLSIVIEKDLSGVLCPQNKEYVNTTDMMVEIAKLLGKKLRLMPFMNFFVNAFLPYIPLLQKAFGSLYYSDEASKMPFEQSYDAVEFKDTVRKSIMP